MNILAYNIIRKMIENPLEVEYRKYGLTGSLYIKGVYILHIFKFRYSDTFLSRDNNLSSNELKKILDVVEYCEAIKIRNL